MIESAAIYSKQISWNWPRPVQMCQAMEATSADLQAWSDRKSKGQEEVAVVKNRIQTEDDGSDQVAAVHWKAGSEKEETFNVGPQSQR